MLRGDPSADAGEGNAMKGCGRASTRLFLPLPVILALAGIAPADGAGMLLGFADEAGMRIIVTGFEDSVDVSEPMWAVLPSGETRGVRFLGRAEGTPENTCRDRAGNFDNLPGLVFGVEGDPLAADMTCPVASAGFLLRRTPLAVERLDLSPLDEGGVAIIENARCMRIERSWRLARIEGGAELWMTLFEPGDSTIVASLILVEDGDLFFEDFVGTISEDMTSVWRIDDNGEFDASWFEIIAAFRSERGIDLVRTWIGAEGENSAWLEAEEGELRPVLRGYRYQAPL
jgi:hypothetical protein